ncbi:MAG: PIN domain-containing protein [Bacteroidia bacterium]
MIVEAYCRQPDLFEIVETPLSVVQIALDIMLTRQLSFWDALIVAAADRANCSVLITEDSNHGQQILGMKVQNPFA